MCTNGDFLSNITCDSESECCCRSRRRRRFYFLFFLPILYIGYMLLAKTHDINNDKQIL